jgi:hypothetical protein
MLKQVQHDRMVWASFFCHPEPGPEIVSGSSISGFLFLVSNLGLKALPCARGSLLMRGYVEIGIHFGLIIFVSFSMYGVLKIDSLPTPYRVLDLTEGGYMLGAKMLPKQGRSGVKDEKSGG